MRVIYFTCGLPGSGKSSYCKDIKRRLDPYGHGLFITRDIVRAELLNEFKNINYSKFDQQITDNIVGRILAWRATGLADTRTGICVIDGCHTDFSQIEYMVHTTGPWGKVNILVFGSHDTPTWFDLSPERTDTTDFEAYRGPDGVYSANHQRIPKHVLEKKRDEMMVTEALLTHYKTGFLKFYFNNGSEAPAAVTYISVKDTILKDPKIFE